MVEVVYQLEAAIEDGPTFSATDTLEDLTAYEYVNKVVAAGDTETIDVQPGDAGDVQLWVMWSDYYDTLTYTVDAGAPHTFDGPLVLVGAGPVALLGATCNTVAIINGSATYNSNVKIFTARVAED